MSHEFPNDLRLKILRNLEIMARTQKWVEKKPGTQSFFLKRKY